MCADLKEIINMQISTIFAWNKVIEIRGQTVVLNFINSIKRFLTLWECWVFLFASNRIGYLSRFHRYRMHMFVVSCCVSSEWQQQQNWSGKMLYLLFFFLSFRLSKIFDELIFMIRNKKKERRVLYGVLWMCNPYTCTVHSSCIEYRFNWYYSVYLFFPNGFLINICVLNSHHLCIECELSKTKPCFDMRHIFRGLQPINGYLGIRSMLQWKRTISIRTPNVSTTLRYVNIVDTLASI